MLTETEQLLITVAVDGELTPAEANAFARLLADRPEAKRLFRQLKATADHLRALPRRTAPSGLVAAVLGRVRPVTAAARKVPRRGSFLPYLVAASVLFAIAAGSFVFFRGHSTNTDHAQQQVLPPPGRPSVLPDPEQVEPVAVAKGGAGEDGGVKGSTDDGGMAKLLPAEPPVVVVVEKPLTPQEKEWYGAGILIDSKPLKRVDPTLPVIFSALEFDKEEPLDRLKKELAKEDGFRLNLFSKTPGAATEHLQAAARAAGVNVFVEAKTAEWIAKRPPGVAFAFYVENLTADELATLLAAVATQVNAQPKPETILGSAHVIPADVPEQKDLKELIGLDWAVPKPVKPADGKPISEGTLKEVVASVKKPGDKAAVVVTYAARLNAGKSSEVKQFLDKRGDRKPGTTPLLIVVRHQA
jgi:hypothetical protein